MVCAISHCFLYILPIKVSAASLVFQALWLKHRGGGEGSDPQNKDFNVSRSWENPSIVRADTIYNPCNVYAPECIFYGEYPTYTSEFLALAMVKKSSSFESDDWNRGKGVAGVLENSLLLTIFWGPASCDRIKGFLFLTHLWQESASLLWLLSLSYWKNVGSENILQLGWKKKKSCGKPHLTFFQKNTYTHTRINVNQCYWMCVYVAYNYAHILCVYLRFSPFTPEGVRGFLGRYLDTMLPTVEGVGQPSIAAKPLQWLITWTLASLAHYLHSIQGSQPN